ncbi:MAG: hypothetical protein C0483_17715 [Pirellula sp.]|nr:hypothetical protein [Pirellula sp.]
MRTSDRPITFRRRPDLQIASQRFGAERYWVIHDPLSLKFTRLRDDEYALFELLDGEHSLDDLVNFYEARFAPQRLHPEEAARFVNMLHSSGLLLAERAGQGESLHERSEKRRREEFRKRWLSPLAVRFRGINPETLFQVMYPFVRPFMSRTALVCGCLFILSAVGLAAVQWRTLAARLPDFQAYFTPTNILILMGVLGVVKVLHEFGHGLTCLHFGGRCHELGVMFLVFTPCLYCNVSDAYRFPNKWHRAAVGAAGIYVELLLASAAMYLWWYTEPGLLNQICLGVTALCSVSTLMFNGNPLMRYDGYYILCDVVETPNLAERSASVLRAGFLRFFAKNYVEGDPFLPRRHRGWYAAYAVASTAYRVAVTCAIVMLFIELARPYKLENVARLLGLAAVVSLIAPPIRRFFSFMNVPGRRRDLRLGRAAAASVVLASLIGVFCFAPLPHRVVGPLELQPYRPERVFVEVRGVVAEAPVRFGQEVHAGDLLLRLNSPDLELAVEELASERDRHRARLDSLRLEQFQSSTAAAIIPQTEQLLASVETRLKEKERERQRLTLRASRDGVLYPPFNVPKPPSGDELPNWSGRPLDADNIGSTLEPGTLIGEVADPRAWDAWIVIDQEDVEFVHVGDHVDVLLDSARDLPLQGRIDEISVGELAESPQRLSNKVGGELATQPGSGQSERPVSTAYSVRVRLTDEKGQFRVGWRGTARIDLAPATLASRVGRWAARTFHFHL